MYNSYSTKGTHIIVDAYQIEPRLLDDIHYLHSLGKFAIAKSNATFVSMVTKKFEPFGCTLLFLLEESHLSFHTYIEDINNKNANNMLAIDFYTCGDCDPHAGINYVLDQLNPERITWDMIERGV